MTQNVKRRNFLQLLLETYHPGGAAQLWGKLPIKEMPESRVVCPIGEPLRANYDFLHKMHYTWKAHYISMLSENLKKCAASAFPEFEKISKRLQIEEKVEKMGNVDPYLYQLLIEKIGLKDRLPICFLQKSPFEEMLRWDREKLLRLIDLLPLADAGKEIKQIVDRNRLMLIYSALNEQQKNYIKHCLVSRHVVCDLQLNLRNWQGTKEALKMHLHQVGLDLFAKGLHQEGTDFLFYLSHLLDTGRGKPLLSMVEHARNEEKKETYFKNLTQVYKFISTHEKS